MEYLDRLIKQYDFINEMRWGDDNLDPPTWEEVRDKHLSDWAHENMSFEYWSAYMQSSIIAAARDLCADSIPKP